jgi:hypothetical protein
MKTVHSQNRTYVSPKALRAAGFRPGQRVAVERTGQNTVTIRPFNKVRKDNRVAAYTIYSTCVLQMSSTKIGRKSTKTMPTTTATRSTVSLSF